MQRVCAHRGAIGVRANTAQDLPPVEQANKYIQHVCPEDVITMNTHAVFRLGSSLGVQIADILIAK